MGLTELLSAIESIFTFYNDDVTTISHLLRVSSNPNLSTYNERIALVLYKTIEDGYMTASTIESLYNSTIADYVERINQYTDETDYAYIDRINSDATLTKLKFCILNDNYYISTYNSKISLESANDNKQLLRMNLYNGYGCHL